MKIVTILTLMALGVFVSSPIHAATKNISDIKVFVGAEVDATGANDQGFVDPTAGGNNKRLTDSAADIKKHLGKSVQLVDSQKDADVVIIVVASGGEAANSTTTTKNVFTGLHTQQDAVAAVHAGMIAGDYKGVLNGYSAPGMLVNLWGYAAGQVAYQAKQWIAANHDKLIAMRTKSSDAPATAQNDAGGQK